VLGHGPRFALGCWRAANNAPIVIGRSYAVYGGF